MIRFIEINGLTSAAWEGDTIYRVKFSRWLEPNRRDNGNHWVEGWVTTEPFAMEDVPVDVAEAVAADKELVAEEERERLERIQRDAEERATLHARANPTLCGITAPWWEWGMGKEIPGEPTTEEWEPFNKKGFAYELGLFTPGSCWVYDPRFTGDE